MCQACYNIAKGDADALLDMTWVQTWIETQVKAKVEEQEQHSHAVPKPINKDEQQGSADFISERPMTDIRPPEETARGKYIVWRQAL